MLLQYLLILLSCRILAIFLCVKLYKYTIPRKDNEFILALIYVSSNCKHIAIPISWYFAKLTTTTRKLTKRSIPMVLLNQQQYYPKIYWVFFFFLFVGFKVYFLLYPMLAIQKFVVSLIRLIYLRYCRTSVL